MRNTTCGSIQSLWATRGAKVERSERNRIVGNNIMWYAAYVHVDRCEVAKQRRGYARYARGAD